MLSGMRYLGSMKPTKELLDLAAENHRAWFLSFQANGTTQTAEEIIEDHGCKFGTFLSSIDRAFRLDPAFRETARIHVRFHYLCSVEVTLAALDIPVHPHLRNEIEKTSDALLESLSKWDIS